MERKKSETERRKRENEKIKGEIEGKGGERKQRETILREKKKRALTL